jgi:hypothetical protein
MERVILIFLINLNIDNKIYDTFLKCIINTPFTYLCNLVGTDYELPEDDAIVSKHVGAV